LLVELEEMQVPQETQAPEVQAEAEAEVVLRA
jgi:hypothetical protein